MRSKGKMVRSLLAASAVLAGLPAAAQGVRLTEAMAEAVVVLDGTALTIARNQDPEARLTGDFARTARACPPFCIQPHEAAPGVATLGELELIAFLQDRVATGAGIVIDARLPEWLAQGTIPGAVNVPFPTLDAANPYRDDILRALGARPLPGGGFDFAEAAALVVFCNGPWSDQAPLAIRHLVAAGYPPERLAYFRGGMQGWLQLGLTTATPPDQG